MPQAFGTRLVFPALFVAGAFAAFALPFHAGPGSSAAVYSTAWAAGAENRAAYVALAAISVVGALICWWVFRSTRSASPAMLKADRSFGFSWWWIALLSVMVACWSLGWGGAILRANLRVGETNYFLEQTRNAAGIGLPAPMRIYRDLEFPYGPLLLELPVWLWRVLGRVGVSVGACYVLGLTAFSTLGFLLLAYILRGLPMTPRARGVFVVCGAFVAMNPLSGPNYSLFKFLWPVAVLVAAAGCRLAVRRFAVYLGGSFIMLMLSPELGVGLTAAIVVEEWVIQRGTRERGVLPWLNFFAPFLALGLFVGCYGVVFLERLRLANSGALNLVIQPMPDLLIFLAVLTWLAPDLVGRLLPYTGSGSRAETVDGRTAALLLGVFVLGLGMLPGALGRADPLHVFFNGLPFWLLSLVAVRYKSYRVQRAWLGAIVLLSLQVQADNFHFYARSLRDVVVAQRRPAATHLDIGRLEQLTQHQAVTAPVLYAIALPDELLLRTHRMLRPTSAPGLAEVWNRASEEQRMVELRQTEWALVPEGDFLQIEHAPGSAPPHSVGRHDSFVKRTARGAAHLLFGFPYKEKRAPYAVGTVLVSELAANWQPVAAFGNLRLYRRLR